MAKPEKPDLLYFVPTDAASFPRSRFAELGIAYAAPDAGEPDVRQASPGPGGAGGLVISAGGGRVLYKEPEQVWRKGPDGKWWVGHWKTARPGPEQLARPRICDGTPVKLRDGNEWIVPRCFCRLPNRIESLPKVLDVGDDGVTPLARVADSHHAIWAEAYAWWQVMTGQMPADAFPMQRRFAFAAAALGVNYRVGLVEAFGLLELFSDEDLEAVLNATIDLDELLAWYQTQEQDAGQKKTPPAATAPSAA
jgi:hypothetical protein